MSSDNGNILEVNSTVSKHTADKVTVENGNMLDVNSSASTITSGKVTVTIDQITEEVIKSETIPPDVKPAIKDFLDSLVERVIHSLEEFQKIDPPQELVEFWLSVLEIVKSFF